MTPKKLEFQIGARLDLEITVPIVADDIEQAAIKSKELEVHDFVKILGEWLDGGMKIVSIYLSTVDR